MNFKAIITIPCMLLILVIFVEAIHVNHLDNNDDSNVLTRHKRASADFFGKIKSSLTSSIGKASASSAGASSGTSSSKTFVHEKPVVHEVEKEIHFDGWELKKSILNTLFQAVKAITGGVTAIKGQLIKGSGYAISHGGKLIAASGDAVTNVGKKIALSAKLLPAEKSPYYKYFGSSSGHSSSHHPTAEDFTSFAHDDLIEYAQPHDIPVFAPEPQIPYLPVDLAYENHYPAPHYGPPLFDTPHSHITNYISTDRKEQEQHYDTFDTTAPEGPKTLDSVLSNQDASQKAIEALRLILRKLPNKLTKLPKDKFNEIQLNDDNDNNNNNNDLIRDNHKFAQQQNILKQYSIPNDPEQIPEFKPIKSLTSTYTFQLGPFESVTKHTVGGLDSDEHLLNPATNTKFHLHNGAFNIAPHTLSHNQQQQPSINQLYFDAAPYRGQRHTSNTNTHPLDLYHTMTLKNSAKNHHHQQQSNQINHSTHNNKKIVTNLNEQQHHSNNNNNAPSQPLKYLPPQSNSPTNFEIHKSIQYQLQ